MEFHLLQMKTSRGFLTSTDPKEKVRIMAFKQKATANEAVAYVSKFKSATGRWPTFQFGNKPIHVPPRRKNERIWETPEQVGLLLEIVTLERDDLDVLAREYNLSFVYIEKFTPSSENFENVESVNMRCQEIDGYVDEDRFIERLEDSLKIDDK